MYVRTASTDKVYGGLQAVSPFYEEIWLKCGIVNIFGNFGTIFVAGRLHGVLHPHVDHLLCSDGSRPHRVRDGPDWRPSSRRSSACASRPASPAGSADGAHRHVLPGRPPRAAPLTVLIGVSFQGGFTCQLRSWRSAACSSRAASPGSAANGAHRHVLPGRLHLPAPLMALGGMFLRDNLVWQRRSWCSPACSSKAASLAGSAHGAHRHVLPGRPPWQRRSWCASACSPGAALPAGSAHGAQQHVPPRTASPVSAAHGAHRHVLPGRLHLPASLMALSSRFFRDGVTRRVASQARPASPRTPWPSSACLLMALIGMPFQGGFLGQRRSFRSPACPSGTVSPGGSGPLMTLVGMPFQNCLL